MAGLYAALADNWSGVAAPPAGQGGCMLDPPPRGIGVGLIPPPPEYGGYADIIGIRARQLPAGCLANRFSSEFFGI